MWVCFKKPRDSVCVCVCVRMSSFFYIIFVQFFFIFLLRLDWIGSTAVVSIQSTCFLAGSPRASYGCSWRCRSSRLCLVTQMKIYCICFMHALIQCIRVTGQRAYIINFQFSAQDTRQTASLKMKFAQAKALIKQIIENMFISK